MSRLITARSTLLLVAVVCANATQAEAGDPKRAAADCKLALDRQEFASGLEQCRTAAKFGDRASAFRIGELYEYGLGVERSIQQASNWYRRSAARGYPLAQRNLAALYERGDSGLQDNWRAFELYKKAAVQGEIYSQYKVGLMYLAGVGVEADEAAGLDWIGKSANGGLPQAANFAASYLERMNAKTRWVQHKLAPYWRKPDIEATEEPPNPRTDALAALGEQVWKVSHQAPLIRQPVAPAPAPKPLVVARADVVPASGVGSGSIPAAADKPESDAEHTRRLVVDLPNQPDAGNLITLVPKAVEVGAAPQPVIPAPLPVSAPKTLAKVAATASVEKSGDKGTTAPPPAVAKAAPAVTKPAPEAVKAAPALTKTAPAIAKSAPAAPQPETALTETVSKTAKGRGAEPAAPTVTPATAVVSAKQPGAQPTPASKRPPVVVAATSKAASTEADSRKAVTLKPSAMTSSTANAPVATAALGDGAAPQPPTAPILVASTAPLAVVVGPKPVVAKTAASNPPVTKAAVTQAPATQKPAADAPVVNVAAATMPATSATEQDRGLAAHASDRYTVQLALMGHRTSVDRFYRLYGMRGEVKYHPTRLDGKAFYVLVYGDFASYAEAKAAAAALPAPVQELRPWVRRFEALQKEYPAPDAGQA